MKSKVFMLVLCVAAFSGIALADVRLVNQDSQAYELSAQCTGSGLSSISANTSSSLGTGPCTVTVKSTGSSATADDGGTLVIKNGTISVQ